jgi:hypothetical protein
MIANWTGRSKGRAANAMALQPLDFRERRGDDSLHGGSTGRAKLSAGCGSVALHPDRR